MTTKFEVSHVTSPDDFPALVNVEGQAFRASEGISLMFPASPVSSLGVRNHQKAWSTDPNTRYLKAALPDGTIIGMAKWYLFLDPPARPDPWAMEFAPNAHVELGRYFFGAVNAARDAKLGGKRHMLMATLVVLPEYQRMGVGHELLRWGLAKADEEQVECWIDASPAGLGLYKKFGWVEVGHLDLDLKDWRGGESKVSRTVHLVRPPTAK
jgi:GNAT superfamily N-acetyltransferase